MRHKHTIALIGLVACLVAAFGYHSDFLRRLRARHIRETILVATDNRRLPSLFAGMPTNFKWDAARALKAARDERRCAGTRRGGLFGKLVSLVERTVYAQAACSSYQCSGSNWIQDSDGQCTGDGCAGSFKQVKNDTRGGQCGGSRQNGENGCTGPNCSPASCNVVACNSCTCTNDADCPSSMHCTNGACVASQCQRDGDCPSSMWCSGGSCMAKQCQGDGDCNNSSQFCCQPDSSGNNAACGARWTCQGKACTGDGSCAISQTCNSSTWTCVNTVCILGIEFCHRDADCAG